MQNIKKQEDYLFKIVEKTLHYYGIKDDKQSIADLVMTELLNIKEPNEDYEMLARENKCMAEALSKLNYTPDQISDICNGADIIK